MKQIFLFLLLLPSLNALSQLTETFSGPEVTSTNAWEGDMPLFAIHPAGQLWFVSPEGAAGSASLRIPLAYRETMTWEMDVKLNFKSTDANNLRICVYAPDTFYIQAGNNTRRVSLYEKEGKGSPKLRITGRKALLDEPYAFVAIRLTLEEGTLWTLYTRKEGEADFYREGTYRMKSPPDEPEALMTLSFRYIKGRVSEYFVDNLKVTHGISEIPDPMPEPEPTPEPEPGEGEETDLELLAIEALSAYELQFYFDKPVDLSEAVCEIDNMGEATLSHGQHPTIVHLRLPEALEDGRTYLVTIEGLHDTEGRWIDAQSWEITYEKDEETPPPPEPGQPGAVIISEVMANPKGLTAFPETEYVELHNASDASVSLNGWAFVYDGKAVAVDGLLLPPGGYAVLYRAGRPIHVDAQGQAVGLAKFPAALANSGKLLQLEDAGGVLIDEFYYPKAQAALSWERSGDEAYLSTDARGGTPGSPNSSPGATEEPGGTPTPSVEAGALVFNELLPEPFAGGSEYVELYNRSGRALSLAGLSLAVRKADGSLNTAYSLAGIPPVEAGGYALLTKDREGVAAFYLLASPESVHELAMPVLANTASTLVLFRTHDGGVVDEVSYSSQWHHASVKDKKGVSLERIDPDAPTQDAANWTSAGSLAGHGTPGYRNSQQAAEGEGGNPMGISPPALREDGLYGIAYRLESPGYRCRLYIYNMAGARVAEIANHELTGRSGEFTWDGRSHTGSRLPIGIYILSAELYNENGLKKHERLVFLIR
jgi:hypothetical protein